MTHHLDLKIIKPTKKEDIPFNPFVHIYAKSIFSRGKIGGNLLTASCVTYNEIEFQCKEIENDLKEIRKKAKKLFDKK